MEFPQAIGPAAAHRLTDREEQNKPSL